MVTALPIAPAVRFHLSLNVANLERALAFYRVLFGREPAKCRPDYAKFELDDPPLVLSLEPTPNGGGGVLNHLGFRMPDSDSLVAMQMRLEQAGIRSRREEGVECCYARQTKFWVTDPDQTLWEIYTLDEDIDHRGVGQSREQMLSPPREQPSAEAVVWEHRLGDAVPAVPPLADGAADEVRLRGTFNMDLKEPQYRQILATAWRALRPGGALVVHTLVADRPFPHGLPQLPGPAGRVQRIPLEREPLQTVEQAGFVGLHLDKFAAGPCFEHDGVQMREMLLSASKAAASTPRSCVVLYKGPFRELRDDDGTLYVRGQRTEVSEATQERLRQSAWAEQFLFLS